MKRSVCLLLCVLAIGALLGAGDVRSASAAEPYRPDLIAFSASPQNPSAGQETTVLARFKADRRPYRGSVTLVLVDGAGRTVREWSERDLSPAFLTPVEGGAGEWLYRASFAASREHAALRLTWRPSGGYGYDAPQYATLALSVGGDSADVGGSGGLSSWRVTRDARHDGDEMKTAALFAQRPDPDSVRLIIERRGLFSGLYDDRTIYPEWEGYENDRYGYGGDGRWRVRFEFTAEQGRHRMKLRWRLNGVEYEHIDTFRVADGASGCDAGLGALGLAALVPLGLGVFVRRRSGRS